MIYELQRNFSSTDRGYKFIISLSNKISPEIRKLNFSRSESWARARSHKSWRAAQEVSIRERQVRLLIALERGKWRKSLSSDCVRRDNYRKSLLLHSTPFLG
jgi:hypothetical protein